MIDSKINKEESAISETAPADNNETANLSQQTTVIRQTFSEKVYEKIKNKQLKCIINPKLIIDANCMYGSHVSKVNPKCKNFIFKKFKNIHIINLEKTIEYLNLLYRFVRFQSQEGKTFLFVETKDNASYYIKREAERCGAYYINKRWISGLFTNFNVVRNSIKKYNNLVRLEQRGAFANISKKELSIKMREMNKLKAQVGGILDMTSLPNFLFVIDTVKNAIAVKEARAQKIPVISVINTNADPMAADFFVPANNEGYKSIRLILTLMADAICSAKGLPTLIADKPDLEEFPVEGDEYHEEIMLKRQKFLENQANKANYRKKNNEI